MCIRDRDNRDLKQRRRRGDDAAVNDNEKYEFAFIRWRPKGILGRASPARGLTTSLAVHLKITILSACPPKGLEIPRVNWERAITKMVYWFCFFSDWLRMLHEIFLGNHKKVMQYHYNSSSVNRVISTSKKAFNNGDGSLKPDFHQSFIKRKYLFLLLQTK